MPLKIIGAGFGRTGTLSMVRALEEPKFFPCHHMVETRKNPSELPYWRPTLDGSIVDWRKLFNGYQARIDWPGAAYWKKLSTAFPASKVILTIRDPEQWYESFLATIHISMGRGRWDYNDGHQRAVSKLAYEILCVGIFENRTTDKDFMISRFLKHRDEVVNSIEPRRLLEFDISEGWSPLCGFLEVETPDTDFPRGKSTQDFRTKMRNGGIEL